MRILVLSQYFWPESFIINDIVRTLDAQGHEVVVATGKPNYPDGKVFGELPRRRHPAANVTWAASKCCGYRYGRVGRVVRRI